MVKKILKPIPILLLILFIWLFYLLPAISLAEERGIEIRESSMILNSILTFLILTSIPLSWLYIIDEMNLGKILDYLKLRNREMGKAMAYGIVGFAFIIFFLVIFAICIKLSGIEYKNPIAKELARTLSLPSIIFIAVIQSSGEEIFFRGFLMEKLSIGQNKHLGILLSSILFGFAHMSYGIVYQVILPILAGIVFGWIVYKSQNLTSSIVSHISFNLFSMLTAHYLSG